MRTDPIPAHEDPSERWLHPSPRLLVMRRTQVATVTVALALAVGLVAGLSGTPALGMGLAGATLVAGVAMGLLIRRRVRAWAYLERQDDLLVRRGLLFSRLSVVPYGRMQFIDVTAGPVERSFGLATVRMHTAAAASDARIPGLTREDAARLRDQLATLGEAHAAGL